MNAFWIGGAVLWAALAGLVIWVGLQRRNRPACVSCGLSIDRDLDRCPYCGAEQPV